jgi:peptidyl-prolyl cis-trans isomerase SurA
MMRKLSVLLTVAVAAAATAFSAPGEPVTINGINGIVHDTVITHQEVRDMTAPALRVLEREYRGQDETIRKKLAQAERENLEQLMERQLVLQDFKTSGYNLPESTLDDLVEDEIRNQYRDRRTLTKSLQGRGLTFEKYRTKLREQYIVGAMRQKYISSEIIVSPHKMEKYYGEHRDQFKVEDEVKLRIIELHRSSDPDGPEPKKVANEILMKLNDGASFEEMAAIYSQRPQQRKSAEWFGKSVLRTELAQVALKLKAGEKSGVIETPDACYLLQVDEIRPERYRPLAEVRDEIEKNLVAEERNRLEKQWVERLKKKTFVRYFF